MLKGTVNIENVENILLTLVWYRQYKLMSTIFNIGRTEKSYSDFVFLVTIIIVGLIPLAYKYIKYNGPYIYSAGSKENDGKIVKKLQKNTGIGIGTILIPYSFLSTVLSSKAFSNNYNYLIFLFACTIGMPLVSIYKYFIHRIIFEKLPLKKNHFNSMILYYSSEFWSLVITCFNILIIMSNIVPVNSNYSKNVAISAFLQTAFVLTIYNLHCTFIATYLYKSFSVGETMIISQIATIFVTDFFHFLYVKQKHALNSFMDVGSTKLAFAPYIMERDETMICIQYMIIVTVIIGCVTTFIMKYVRNCISSSTFLVLLYSLLTGQYSVSIYLSRYIFNDENLNIVTWMVRFVFYTKSSGSAFLNIKNIYVIVYWFFILISGMYIISRHGDYLSNNTQIIKRKLFHVIAVLLFVPISYINIELLNVALGVAFSLFMLIEFIRINDIDSVVGMTISEYLNENIDERDQGQVILTHMYLLLGCSIPLWVGSVFMFHQYRYGDNGTSKKTMDTGVIYMCLLSGVVSVGIGDAVGSLVGKSFDAKYKIKWPKSKKSVQGTLAMTISVFMCNTFIYLYSDILFAIFDSSEGTTIGAHHYVIYEKKHFIEVFIPLLFVSFAVSLLEASTLQIDNIVLPLFLYSTIRLTNW